MDRGGRPRPRKSLLKKKLRKSRRFSTCPLPAAEAAQFADLARSGDFLNLMKAAEQFVASANPEYRPFLDRLHRKLCEGFRVRQIRQLIEEQ